MFFAIFTKLCEEKGVPPTRAATEMGFSNSTATKWSRGATPSGKALKTIAEYFGVSISYLLGIDETKEAPAGDVGRTVPDEEYELLERFRNTDEATREVIRRLLEPR